MIRLPVVGEELGRYRLLRELGRGGMGVVYVALDASLDREVALKIIAPQLAGDDDYRARFKREALALSRMDSNHVVQVHDHGELDGCLFLVTQLVPDGDLLQRLQRPDGLPPGQAVDLVMQVLDGLDDAHRAGVVHRDVKPSNILLRQRSERLHAYLCDFGIASSPGEQVTRTGALVGSFPYMAPERHRAEQAGVPGDVYSVGCVLWQVLTGTAPYAGTDVEIAVAHLQAALPQLPPTDDFSRAVNAILGRALAKLPEDRYASARAMRADLAAIVASAPEVLALPEATQVRHSVLPGVVAAAQPAPPAPPAAPRRSARRSGALAALAVAGVLVVTTGVALAVRDTGGQVREPTAGATVTAPAPEVPPSIVGGVTLSTESAPGAPDVRPGAALPGGPGTQGPGPTALPDSTPGSTVGPTSGSAPGSTPGSTSGPRPSRSPKPSRTPKPSRAPEPSRTPSPTPAPPPPTYECWDGTGTDGPEECSEPSGVAGLAWVYKDPSGCVQEGGSANRLTVLTCGFSAPGGRATITYTHWSSVAAAKGFFRDEYAARPDAWRSWGFRWSKSTPKREVVQRRVHLYRDGPYSVLVKGDSERAFTSALDAVRYRKPGKLRGRPA